MSAVPRSTGLANTVCSTQSCMTYNRLCDIICRVTHKTVNFWNNDHFDYSYYITLIDTTYFTLRS